METTDFKPIRRSVGIAIDSAAALPSLILKPHRIAVASMEVSVGDETFPDGPDSDTDSIYQRVIAAPQARVSTSAPRPEQWLHAITEATSHGIVGTEPQHLEKVRAVLCITVSARLSASYDSALVAARLATDTLPDVDVRVLDSGAAAGSQALIAMAAARAADRGDGISEVMAAAESVKQRVRLTAMLDTLDHLRHSGRVPTPIRWAAKGLGIKPVLSYDHGGIRLISRPFSRRAAMKRILTEASRDLTDRRAHVNVMHVQSPAEAERLAYEMEVRFDCESALFVTQFHPFMGLHAGPGLVGAAWWGE